MPGEGLTGTQIRKVHRNQYGGQADQHAAEDASPRADIDLSHGGTESSFPGDNMPTKAPKNARRGDLQFYDPRIQEQSVSAEEAPRYGGSVEAIHHTKASTIHDTHDFYTGGAIVVPGLVLPGSGGQSKPTGPSGNFHNPQIRSGSASDAKPAVTVQKEIIRKADQYGVPRALALALAYQTSRLDQSTVIANRIGVFGLTSDQAKALGVNPYNWRQNIDAGIRRMVQAKRQHGSWKAALKSMQVPGLGGRPGNLNSSQVMFARGVAARTGLSLPVVYAWVANEQPPDTNPAAQGYNWLNVSAASRGVAGTIPATGYPRFASLGAAVAATSRLILTSGYYAGIRAAIKTGNPVLQARAIQNSPWAAGHYGYGHIEAALPTYSGGSGGLLKTAKAIRNGSLALPKGSNGISVISAPLPTFTMTSGYGQRGGEFHYGVDLAAPQGTPIHAMIGGTVITNTYQPSGAGNYVSIKDNKGRVWMYFHQAVRSPLKVGTKVKAGDQIGVVGSTGESTGPHLDIHLQINGEWADPTEVVRKAFGVGWGHTHKTMIPLMSGTAAADGGGGTVPSADSGSAAGTVDTDLRTQQDLTPYVEGPDTTDVAYNPNEGVSPFSALLALAGNSAPISPETRALLQRQIGPTPPTENTEPAPPQFVAAPQF